MFKEVARRTARNAGVWGLVAGFATTPVFATRLFDYRHDVQQAQQEADPVGRLIEQQNLDDEHVSVKRVAEFTVGELGAGALLLTIAEAGQLLAWRRARAQRSFDEQLRQMHGLAAGPRHRA